MRSLILGVLIGAGAGLGAGLLYAPVSGRRARRKMRDNARKMCECAEHFVHERKEHFETARQRCDFAPRDIDGSLDDETREAVAGR